MSRKDNLTKVTLQTFVQWKKRKLREKVEKEKKDKEKKKEKYMAGAKVGMSGREMFMFDPKMIQQEVRKLSLNQLLTCSILYLNVDYVPNVNYLAECIIVSLPLWL